MKRINLWCITALCALLFTACSAPLSPNSPILSDEPPETPYESENTNTPGNFISSVVSEDDTVAPQEGMVRSRLTNQWVTKEVANTRPIAVTIPNEAAALPHYSLGEASIIYEANVEGRMTRMMAIYEDWTTLSKIGNIRSLRTYFGYWSFEWDAFLVHYGGPFYINDLIEQETTQNINGLTSTDSTAFYRSTDRKEPHNVYTSGEALLDIITEKGYDLTYRGLTPEKHFNFTTAAEPNTLTQYGMEAKTAIYIDMSGCYPLTRCYFEYNEDDGLYYRSQHLSGGTDGPHIDAATGKQLSFKNILVQNTYYNRMEDGYLVFQCHDTTRDGWYFTNGKGIHVTWEKEADYAPTRYFDDYGNEITMNTGKTMICIVEDGDMFSFH